MAKKIHRPKDINQLAKSIVDETTSKYENGLPDNKPAIKKTVKEKKK